MIIPRNTFFNVKNVKKFKEIPFMKYIQEISKIKFFSKHLKIKKMENQKVSSIIIELEFISSFLDELKRGDGYTVGGSLYGITAPAWWRAIVKVFTDEIEKLSSENLVSIGNFINEKTLEKHGSYFIVLMEKIAKAKNLKLLDAVRFNNILIRREYYDMDASYYIVHNHDLKNYSNSILMKVANLTNSEKIVESIVKTGNLSDRMVYELLASHKIAWFITDSDLKDLLMKINWEKFSAKKIYEIAKISVLFEGVLPVKKLNRKHLYALADYFVIYSMSSLKYAIESGKLSGTKILSLLKRSNSSLVSFVLEKNILSLRQKEKANKLFIAKKEAEDALERSRRYSSRWTNDGGTRH
jgi:hypothetical protein